jgi:hypothetical protein
MRGSLREKVSSVSRQSGIYTSINEYHSVCPNCHQGLFSYDYITLCPPKEVLEYLIKYMKDARNQMPLYQVSLPVWEGH